MYSVVSEQSCEQIIKKSRFIGVIAPCDSEAGVVQVLSRLQARHPAAHHIAFAFRLLTDQGIVMRFHDAGEPGGTAGKPIYQHIEGNDLINTLIAVVRYFGGVKLGAGGLTRAYGSTARQVFEAGQLQRYTEYCYVALVLEYPQLQGLQYQVKQLQGDIHEQSFSDLVRLIVKLPVESRVSFLSQYPKARVITA